MARRLTARERRLREAIVAVCFPQELPQLLASDGVWGKYDPFLVEDIRREFAKPGTIHIAPTKWPTLWKIA